MVIAGNGLNTITIDVNDLDTFKSAGRLRLVSELSNSCAYFRTASITIRHRSAMLGSTLRKEKVILNKDVLCTKSDSQQMFQVNSQSIETVQGRLFSDLGIAQLGRRGRTALMERAAWSRSPGFRVAAITVSTTD